MSTGIGAEERDGLCTRMRVGKTSNRKGSDCLSGRVIVTASVRWITASGLLAAFVAATPMLGQTARGGKSTCKFRDTGARIDAIALGFSRSAAWALLCS